MKQHHAFLFAAMGYALLIILVFGRVLFPSEGMMIFGDDIHRYYYFFRQFFLASIHNGVFPWWNPYLFSGTPLIANPQFVVWYPVSWIFLILPIPMAFSWYIAFHVFWGCLGMFIFIRHIRPIRPISLMGSWIGGVVFGLSGFFMARMFAGHMDVIAAASWMPWVVGAFWRLIIDTEIANKNLDTSPISLAESKRSAFKAHIHSQSGAVQNFIGSPHRFIIASVVFALQLLAGYQTMAFFTVIAVGIIALLCSIQVKSLIPLFRVILAGAFGVALAAIQILPAAEFFAKSIRTFDFPYSWHSYGSLEWRSLLQFLNPFQFGNQYSYVGPPPNFIEHSAFVGVGGLVLSLIGLIGPISPMSLIVFFGLWVSLGPNAPFDLQKILWQFIPMYHYLRIPPRHLILVVFGLAGLAGIGFSRIKNIWLQRLIGAIVVLELLFFARSFIELKPIPEARHDKELIALLKKDQQPHRVLQNFGAWLPQRDVLDFDGVMAYGIQSATGYDPSILRSYYEFIAAASLKSGEEAVLDVDVQVPYFSSDSADAIDTLNIKYLMVPIAYDPFKNNRRYSLLREDKKQEYRLYENLTVFPRFYFSNKECGTANVTSYTPNRIEVAVLSTCDDTLLSSENWYPGWHATIDGEEITIGKLNNTFRTLFVSKGNHTIVYRYKPTIFFIGAGISIFTMILLGFWWNFLKKRTV